MPDNGGSFLRGFRGGYGIGGDIMDRRRRRDRDRLADEMQREERMRGQRRDVRAEESHQEQLQAALERRADRRAGAYGTTEEIERALTQQLAKRPAGGGMVGGIQPPTNPDDAEMETALRTRRAAIAPAEFQRDRARHDQEAGLRAEEFGSLEEIEAALTGMAGKADIDMAPEDVAMESALRRRRASTMEQQRRQAAGGHTPRETVDLDPETGEVISRRITRAVGQPPAATPPAAAPAAPGGNAPRTIATREEYEALPPGATFVWNGRQGRKP